MDELGLRERKKRETRQRISNVATSLFIARGFDNVTVAEIAEAANVSKMTVFNYFPRKEELYFDRGAEAAELLHAAITARAPGESVIEALRGLMIRLTEQRHPLGALLDTITRFVRTVQDSPSLQTAALEMVNEAENHLAGEFAELTGEQPTDPVPALAAALVIATMRVVYQHATRRLLAGERADDIYPDQIALINRAFDMLAAAIGDQIG
jgi:AcrR family transcriptional regulator